MDQELTQARRALLGAGMRGLPVLMEALQQLPPAFKQEVVKMLCGGPPHEIPTVPGAHLCPDCGTYARVRIVNGEPIFEAKCVCPDITVHFANEPCRGSWPIADQTAVVEADQHVSGAVRIRSVEFRLAEVDGEQRRVAVDLTNLRLVIE